MREEKTRSLPIELPFAKAREADRPCLRLRPYKELVVPLEELSQDVEDRTHRGEVRRLDALGVPQHDQAQHLRWRGW